MSQSYPHGNYPRGIAYIVCNTTFDGGGTGWEDRPGAEEDRRMLVDAFKELGFDIRDFSNLTMVETLKQAKKVAKMDHSAYDCLVVALSTHGDTRKIKSEEDYGMEGFDFFDEVDLLSGTDAPFEFEELTKLFNERNCPTLKDKPKLFFLQACRGNELADSVLVQPSSKSSDFAERIDRSEQQPGVKHSLDMAIDMSRPVVVVDLPEPKNSMMETDMINLSKGINSEIDVDPAGSGPLESEHEEMEVVGGADEPVEPNEEIVSKKTVISRDYLAMWASPPGYFAFHTDAGSPFIRRLTSVLVEKHTEADLLTMLTEVNRKVATEYETRMDEAHLNERRVVPSIEHMLRKSVSFEPKVKPAMGPDPNDQPAGGDKVPKGDKPPKKEKQAVKAKATRNDDPVKGDKPASKQKTTIQGNELPRGDKVAKSSKGECKVSFPANCSTEAMQIDPQDQLPILLPAR